MPDCRFSFRRAAFRLAAALALLTFLPGSASAQYFGRNKVQYETFDWRILKTEHFDIYHYPEEERAVQDAAKLAERWYDRLSSVFERQFTERKSIIFYADQSDFQQTTVVRGLIGEGTGGVTEGLRTRVVLPFTGDWEDTDHVLGHELVHVFQYDIFRDNSRQGSGGGVAATPDVPLWMVEGLAEYLSLGRYSPLTSMWIRDALARDELPTVRQLSRDPRLFPYRWGQGFWAYVGGRWGDVAATRLFARATQIGPEAAMEEVLGLEEKQLSEDWKTAIRDAYGPVIERRQTPQAAGTRLLPQKERELEDYISPVLSPDGSRVAFLSTRNLFGYELFVADARTGEIQGKLFSADSNQHFDSLRFLDSAGSWSPDGTKFAFVVAARGDNEIAILDVGSRRIERRIGMESVGAIQNPAWSPDGRSIAVSASSGGLSDLYLVDVASGSARKLTDDAWAELQPEWSPDGRSLAFVTDRVAGASPGELRWNAMGIWLLDVASGQMRELVQSPQGAEYDPQFGPGGRDLYFLSNRAGVSDLYRLDVASGATYKVTNLTTGVSGITQLSPALTVSPSDGRVMFSVFYDAGYQIHALAPEAARGETVAAPPDEAVQARAALLPPTQPANRSLVAEYLNQAAVPAATGPEEAPRPELADYRPGLRLDFIGPSAGIGVSSYGTSFGGEITAFFSDMLGQRDVGLAIYGGTGTLDEFGAEGYYLNRAQRLEWGFGGGHVPYISAFTTVGSITVDVDGQQVPATLVQQIRQTVTQDQVQLISRYPLSRTRRFEATVGAAHLSYENELFEVVFVGNQDFDRNERDLQAPESLQFYQASFAYVGDNSYFGYTSPARGWRYRFEVEPTFGDLEFQSVTADYRRYFFARPVTFAARALHFGRYGSDGESDRLVPLYLGRPTLVRGYEIGDIDLSECTPVPGQDNACPEFDRLVGSRIGVLNLELRFPLFGTEGYGLFNLPFLPTELAAFVDAGAAWTKDSTPDLRFDRDTVDRVPVVSAGISARVLLGGFAVLELYYAKPFQRPEEDWVTGFTIAPGW
ncbi:MAG TPA: BamA/TamA family outer membrane protein [Thermoanaerobaculia bacterium]|nr:BamA/TamA family outer membrane protein [Thermoanaerobaculia bacterium]